MASKGGSSGKIVSSEWEILGWLLLLAWVFGEFF